jgi:flavoprotein
MSAHRHRMEYERQPITGAVLEVCRGCSYRVPMAPQQEPAPRPARGVALRKHCPGCGRCAGTCYNTPCPHLLAVRARRAA